MIEVCQHCFEVKDCELVGVTYLCNEHKHLKQYQPKEKKTNPIKKESEKRAKENKAYKKAREEYLQEHEDCECCIQEQDQVINPATEIHHKKGRIGKRLIDKRFFLAVCRDCHEFIENNPEWAKQNGYSLQRI